jgi:hypothetical protein
MAFRYESKLSRTGWLYEARVRTADSQRDTYVCVFEDAPDGLPIGVNLNERVVFNGYFFKLMRYEAADVPRAAPLVVGRIGWTPRPAAPASNRSAYWLAGGLAVMFVISLTRWFGWLRRITRKAAPSPTRRARPNDEIEPAEFARFLDALPPEPKSEERPAGSKT